MDEKNGEDWRAKLAVAVAAGACFVVFTEFRDGDFGALATFSIAAVTIGASTRWDLRNRWYYWGVLLLISLAHLVFVTQVSIKLPSPTIKVAPLVILDYVLIVLLIYASDRLFGSRLRNED